MKTESQCLGVANYSQTFYELENELDWFEFLENTQASPAQKRFNQGKCDALFLIEPESEDFDYLCGWHWQTEKLIQDAEAVSLEFGEF
jgi:hypothetical protein